MIPSVCGYEEQRGAVDPFFMVLDRRDCRVTSLLAMTDGTAGGTTAGMPYRLTLK